MAMGKKLDETLLFLWNYTLGSPWMGTLKFFSLLVSKELSTNQLRIYFFVGYLRLAKYIPFSTYNWYFGR